MAKKIYEENNISAIAQAIRAKTGLKTMYKTSEMPEGVAEVYTSGMEAGYESGYESGYATSEYMHLSDVYPSTYIIPEYISKLKNSCFLYDNTIEYITTYASDIGNSAFEQCTALIEARFDYSIRSWGSSVFSGCTNLKKVTFDTNNHINQTTFNNCINLEEVYFTGVGIDGAIYLHQTPKLKKECAYYIAKKLLEQYNTPNQFMYTVKFHADVWQAMNDKTASGYEAPPRGGTWENYVQLKCYNI